MLKHLHVTFAVLSMVGMAQAQTEEAAPSPPMAMAAQIILNTDNSLIPFRCPIEKIRTAYQNLVNPDDTLMALAIEKQTLAICRQSQEALIRIAENENRLTDLFAPIIAPPPPPEVPEPIVIYITPEPEPDLGASGLDMVDPEAVEMVEIPPATTNYSIGAVMRDPDGMKVMLLKDDGIHTGREGEVLRDGTVIVNITQNAVVIEDVDGNVFTLE